MRGNKIIVLGIYDGHNAGACLLEGGKVIAAISEERISRQKNDAGYPRKAIDKVLDIGECTFDDIDIVALGSRYTHDKEFYRDWEWYKVGYREQELDSAKNRFTQSYISNRLKERKKLIADHLGVPESKIAVIEHHLAHAASAYFGSPWAGDEKVLVLTCDGSGDGICASVNIGENGTIYRMAETPNDASIGKIYSRVTLLLGMKPWEHEYKVMGLAPYADEKGVSKSYNVINALVDVKDNELTFSRKGPISADYCFKYLKTELSCHRFDWIAGAVQKTVEELITRWVKNAIKYTGIRKLACAGGIFMNVKLNMRLLELEEVDDLFVFPSCGDESIAIGAAYEAYASYLKEHGEKVRISPLGPIYFGPSFSEEEIEYAIKNYLLDGKNTYSVRFCGDINSAVAELLASNQIVARFDGRMEWGARALGNRSILADSSKWEMVRRINITIKQRDFWMPFAPAILHEEQSEYILNTKNIEAPYMIMAFRTKQKMRESLIAAIHPYDLTTRPQVLEREMNPDYYDLITKYKNITGRGAILNTSFNLHGEPIVCTPYDAILTYKNSSLKYLALGNYLIEKANLQT